MASNPQTYNPYVGPRPFENTQRDIERFFGRARETRDIISLLVAQSTLLVYGKSGTGKSSLLNAAIIPMLSSDEFYVELPTARVQGVIPLEELATDVPNSYMYNALAGWLREGEDRQRARMRLADFLKSRPISRFNADGDPIMRLIIFDQFEELFIAYPKRWPEREDFFKQVRDALNDDQLKPLRIVFVMREDYIAELDRYANILPDNVRTTFRLERLRREQARLAIISPLEKTSRHFREDGANELLTELLAIRGTDQSAHAQASSDEFIEPVVLQVVCENMWRLLPSTVDAIGSDEVRQYAQVENSLLNFYEQCVAEAVAESGVETRAIRRWFANKLITAGETRGTVAEGRDTTEGLSNHAVLVLARRHIIRAEERANARWYELAHDRFIEPIRRSNEAFFLEQERLQAEAERARARIAQEKYSAVVGSSAFVAYHGKDQIFTRRLFAALARYGIDTWVDWANIPVSADWMKALNAGIDSADNFIIVLSSNALNSKYCMDATEYALRANKRIIPIVYQEEESLGQVPSHLASLRWVRFAEGDDFNATLEMLLEAVGREQSYVQEHTRLLVHAREWATRGRNTGLLLSDDELRQAEEWLAQTAAREPKPTELHTEFILASRHVEDQRQRSLWRLRRASAVLAVVGALALMTTVVAFNQASDSGNQAATATVAQGQAVVAQQTAIVAQEQAVIRQTEAIARQQTSDAAAHAANTQVAIAAATLQPIPPTLTAVSNQVATGEFQIQFLEGAYAARIATLAPGLVAFPPLDNSTPMALLATLTKVAELNTWLPITSVSQGVEMVQVPAGCFFMGSGYRREQQPVHEVCFNKPFWIDRYEITRAQYGACPVEVCSPAPENQFSTLDNQPINQVSWVQAQAYCAWRGAGLPTEAQWEYAARGPDSPAFPWGNLFVGDNVVWGAIGDEAATAVVGSKPEGVSWIGAYDMAGNVWEWVSTIYHDYPYPVPESDEERDEWLRRDDTSNPRVMRGGSFSSQDSDLRTTTRFWNGPTLLDVSIGFRCARSELL
jgi:formylglycine-generating enzyme required for sulfatase activity